jgi:hypothetical protein
MIAHVIQLASAAKGVLMAHVCAAPVSVILTSSARTVAVITYHALVTVSMNWAKEPVTVVNANVKEHGRVSIATASQMRYALTTALITVTVPVVYVNAYPNIPVRIARVIWIHAPTTAIAIWAMVCVSVVHASVSMTSTSQE